MVVVIVVVVASAGIASIFFLKKNLLLLLLFWFDFFVIYFFLFLFFAFFWQQMPIQARDLTAVFRKRMWLETVLALRECSLLSTSFHLSFLELWLSPLSVAATPQGIADQSQTMLLPATTTKKIYEYIKPWSTSSSSSSHHFTPTVHADMGWMVAKSAFWWWELFCFLQDSYFY